MNKLLQRQIQKYLGGNDKTPENLAELLNVISESYDHYEKDRKMLERSIDLSSKEMIELNNQLKREKEELSKVHNELGLLFANIGEVFFSIDMTQCRLLQISLACEKVYGYTQEDFYSEPDLWLNVVAEEDKTEISNQYQLILAGKSWTGEYRICQKNKMLKWVETKVTPTLDKEGNLIRIDGVTSDITARKRAEENLRYSESRLKQAQSIAHIGNWEVSFAGNISRWSDEAYRIYGLGPEEHQLSFESWLSFIHPDDLDEVKKEIERSRSTLSDYSHYHRIIRKDGAIRHVLSESKYEFNHEGRPIGMYGIVHDVTDRKHYEQELKILNEQIAKRAEELAASNDELQRFAYVASHDLQEPLRMVSSFLQLLQKKYDGQLDATARQYIAYAVDGSDRMKRLILDLLEYSRVGTNRDKFSTADIGDVVKQVIHTFDASIRETSARIEIQPLPVIKVNRMQIMQLFQNLVSNAFKYNRSPVPEIQIGCEEKKENWQFFVKDNGIGIDQKFYDKVFAIFQRLHNKKQFSGTGIGLAICKKIVEKHGGAIWIESTPGKGSSFFFTLKK